MQASPENATTSMGRCDLSTLDEHFQKWRPISRREHKYWDLLRVPNRIRCALLVNRWAPWVVYAPYITFEWILRNSPRTRRRWSEHSPSKARKTAKKLTQRYPYDCLETEDSIRLLCVLPGAEDEPVACTISHHRLNDPPDYVAISYSWNDDSESSPDTLKCEEHDIVVQKTVFQLLKRLRKVDQALTLWIDAICINQADSKEKGPQVAMMGRIYSSASSVLVWVGVEDGRSARLAHFIGDAAQRFGSGNRLRSEQLSGMSVEWTDLALFLERPWFSRTWVLQEVCLAKSCNLRCGPYCWSWKTLEFVFDSLLKLNIDDVPGAARRLSQGVVQFSRSWNSVRSRSTVSMAQLLSATRGTLASLPVDKVYGILSLADDSLGVRADYEASVQEVYVDVAMRLVVRAAPEVLAAASDNVWNEIPRLPTWVPDWACVDKPKSLCALRHQHMPPEIQLHEAEPVHTDGGTMLLKKGLLRLRMLPADLVRGTGVPWAGNGPEPNIGNPDYSLWDIGSSATSRLEQWYTMLPQYMQGDKRCYAATGEHRGAALMRTIVADSVSLPSCCQSWQKVYPAFKNRLSWLQRVNTASFHSSFGSYQHDDPMAEYHNAVKTLCHKRTLFFTRQGFMGLGPFNTLPFDRIVVVPGVRTPIVMRKTIRGRYRLIGECYIHGWKRPENVSQTAEIVTIE